MGVNQNGQSFCVTYSLDEQAEHIADVLKYARDRGARLIEPTAEAERRWVRIMRAKASRSREFQAQCTPNWQNNEGGKGTGIIDDVYGGGPVEFFDLTRAWRQDGRLEGLNVA
jgi:hypothetical protein